MERSHVMETKNVHVWLLCGLSAEIETNKTKKWDKKVVFTLLLIVMLLEAAVRLNLFFSSAKGDLESSFI